MPDTAHDPVRQREIERIDRLAELLDSRFRIPGIGIRFGLDTAVGLIPGVGDALVALPSGWMIWRAYEMGLPKRKVARMAWNTALDFGIGSIPLVGDIFDLGFKSNLRNARILREGLHLPTTPRRVGGLLDFRAKSPEEVNS
jgi:hypothetical protein